METSGEDPVLDIRELPAAQHPVGISGVASLGVNVRPVWRDRRNEYPVTRFKVLDVFTDFHNHPAGFVAENYILPWP